MDRQVAIVVASLILAANTGALSAPTGGEADAAQVDPVKILVGRLDLDRYKATIKGLTQFADRHQGTDRNRGVRAQTGVKTERSIRFVLWNNEETGLNGAWAYVTQRAALGRTSATTPSW